MKIKLLAFILTLSILVSGCAWSAAEPRSYHNAVIASDNGSLLEVENNTLVVSPLDSHIEIAAGNVEGKTSVNKFGRNTEVDANIVADIWDGGSTGDISLIWVAPTSDQFHSIVSTSNADNATGGGARTIQIYGLDDWDTPEISEVITMNGTSNVTTANSYVIIHRMKVLTSGNTSINVGDLRAYAKIDSTVTAEIDVGTGQTQMAVYGIPSVQDAFMPNFYISILRANATGGVDFRLLYNPNPQIQKFNFLVKQTLGMTTAGTSSYDQVFLPYKVFEGPGIIKMQVVSGANNNDISGGFDLILVDK